MTTTHVLAGVGLLALGLVAGYVLRGPRRRPAPLPMVTDDTAEYEPLRDQPEQPRQARPQDEADWWKPEGWQLDEESDA